MITTTPLSSDLIFTSAVKFFFAHEQAINLIITPSGIQFRLPTTRNLAKSLDVSHSYILPFFGVMEEEGLVTREERVGILTTMSGSKKIIRILHEEYHDESMALFGPDVFRSLCTMLDAQ